MVWFVFDEDCEGEVILWYLFEVLGLDFEKIKCIVFYEIIKIVILKVIENLCDIDVNLVNVQQVCCILDRIVGFEFLLVLWKKVKFVFFVGCV